MSTDLRQPPADSPATQWPAFPAGVETARQSISQTSPPATLPAPLQQMLTRLEASPLSAPLRHIFVSSSRILDLLRLARDSFKQERMMLSTLSTLKHVRKEGSTLLDFIESVTVYITELNQPLGEALGNVKYAIKSELWKVFEDELSGFEDDPPAALDRVKLESAYGLLRDCFQQSVVALARIFEPKLEAEHLFNDLAFRRQQSLELAQDLWNLVKFARRAAVERDHFAVVVLTEHLKRFRNGSMRHLMYKDWEECERFVARLSEPQRFPQAVPLVEELSCYLETLLVQIKRRSALSSADAQEATDALQ